MHEKQIVLQFLVVIVVTRHIQKSRREIYSICKYHDTVTTLCLTSTIKYFEVFNEDAARKLIVVEFLYSNHTSQQKKAFTIR